MSASRFHLAFLLAALASCAKPDALPPGSTQGTAVATGSNSSPASGTGSGGPTSATGGSGSTSGTGSSGSSSGTTGISLGGGDGGCVKMTNYDFSAPIPPNANCLFTCCGDTCVTGSDSDTCSISDAGPAVEVDGGARLGVACGRDGLVCPPTEFCLDEIDNGGPGYVTHLWSCVAIPSCNADPTCNCFALDAGLACNARWTTLACSVSDGVVQCTHFP
ncbi:MAG: hypothetical protein JST54_34465 [Deltaproteobacteria bacterium]|nr:hypothetical protein [Deltaproteobacteria bacterium]